jgi:hypothetical protein
MATKPNFDFEGRQYTVEGHQGGRSTATTTIACPSDRDAALVVVGDRAQPARNATVKFAARPSANVPAALRDEALIAAARYHGDLAAVEAANKAKLRRIEEAMGVSADGVAGSDTRGWEEEQAIRNGRKDRWEA